MNFKHYNLNLKTLRWILTLGIRLRERYSLKNLSQYLALWGWGGRQTLTKPEDRNAFLSFVYWAGTCEGCWRGPGTQRGDVSNLLRVKNQGRAGANGFKGDLLRVMVCGIGLDVEWGGGWKWRSSSGFVVGFVLLNTSFLQFYHFKRPNFNGYEFLGCFMVLEAKWRDFYVINRRNTLENLADHLCGLGKQSSWEGKAFVNSGLSMLSH